MCDIHLTVLKLTRIICSIYLTYINVRINRRINKLWQKMLYIYTYIYNIVAIKILINCMREANAYHFIVLKNN